MNDLEYQCYMFSDFLNGLLDHLSDEHGNYYMNWSESECIIVDKNDNKCTNDFIYQEIQKYMDRYNFEFTDQMTFRNILAR